METHILFQTTNQLIFGGSWWLIHAETLNPSSDGKLVTSVIPRTCGFNMLQQFESRHTTRSTGARHVNGDKTVREIGDCVVCEC